MSSGDILKILSVLVTFFAIVMLYVLEMDYFSNTINSNSLTIRSLLIAALFGGGVGWYFSTFTEVLLEQFQLILSIAVFFAMLGPLAGSLSNRLLAGEDVVEKRCRVIEYKPFSTSIMGIPKNYEFRKEGFALVVRLRGIRERFVYRYNAWPGIEGGDLIGLPFKQGFWGYDVLITDLKLENALKPSDLPQNLYHSDSIR